MDVRVFVPCKPHTTNAERGIGAAAVGRSKTDSNKVAFVHRGWTRTIRKKAKEAAEQAGLDRVEGPVVIQATPHTTMGSGDPGAHNPAVKAAIDGLVDAGVLKNDKAETVRGLMQWAPVQANPKTNTGIELILRQVRNP